MFTGGPSIATRTTLGFVIAAFIALGLMPVPNADARHRDSEEAQTCSCKASIRYSRPDVRWNGDSVVFVPRVDLSIRTKGDGTEPNWNVKMDWSGQSSFSEGTVPLPDGTTFSGSREWGGACFKNRIDFRGLQLPQVTVASLARSIFGEDDSLEGLVQMKAELSSTTGCDVTQENRQFTFDVEDFGNLDPSGWRRVR